MRSHFCPEFRLRVSLTAPRLVSQNPLLRRLELAAQFLFLVSLDASSCSLECFPEDVTLPVLTTLNIAKNKLTDLRVGSWLPMLTTLDVSDNDIKRIWPLENCPNLVNLDLTNNRLSGA